MGSCATGSYPGVDGVGRAEQLAPAVPRRRLHGSRAGSPHPPRAADALAPLARYRV